RASPAWAGPLKGAGINVVSLANNHLLVYGPLAVYATLETLRGYGIAYVGGGGDLNAASYPLVRAIRGLTLGFLAFACDYYARKGRPGCLPCDIRLMRRLISSLRQTVDGVIVSIHDGVEYVDYPTRYMMSLCRAAAGAGAALVLGHHPHVVQGLEAYG